MRILSFSNVRFVRAILEGRKTQTIRPLFRKIIPDSKVTYSNAPKIAEEIILGKKPIHKVGDKVKLVYKQRVLKKDDMFCPCCGMVLDKYYNIKIDGDLSHGHGKTECLPKHFATAKIIDVFEILMEYVPLHTGGSFCYKIEGNNHIQFESNDKNLLAEKDGFDSAEDMFRWFDKKYCLLEPKRFAVYRFEVIK